MSVASEKPAKDAALNMRLPADLLARAKTHAESRGVSLAGLVRMLLIREMEAKAAAGREADASVA